MAPFYKTSLGNDNMRGFYDAGLSEYLSQRTNDGDEIYINNENLLDENEAFVDEISFLEQNSVNPIFPNENLPLVPFYSNIDFLKLYFSNLYDGFLHNEHGSCGYTSIGMLMSFYDCYWNKNIINTVYENGVASIASSSSTTFNSPGLLSVDAVPNTTPLSSYITIQEENNTFLWKLIQIGISEGLYTRNSISSLTVNFDYMQTLINGYCADFNALGFGEMTAHSVQRTDSRFSSYADFRNSLISLLNQGIPVCLGGGCVGGGSHQCVAYEYDYENDIIYGHLGYINQDRTQGSRANLDAFFMQNNIPKIADYFYVEIGDDLHHDHSNRFRRLLNNPICSCKLSTHLHSYLDIPTNNEYHMHQCVCGYYNESHSYVAYFGAYRCRKCGYIYDEPNSTN